jgi:lysophospholipase L1-like esterase
MNVHRAVSRIALALAAAALLCAAGPAAAQDTGSADFTRYAAIGDSLTAAFASGGLHEDVQRLSYPALIARQAGVASFQQPLAGAPGIPPLLAIQGLGPGAPVIVPRSAQPGSPLNLNLPRPYDNMAVPGFDVHDVLVTRAGNQIVNLILRGLGTQLEQVAALQPTFVTVWIGNNDVLGAATSGLVIEGVTLSTVPQFEADFRSLITTLDQLVGADLAVATIPDVAALPFVTTIPPVVVDPVTREPILIGGQLIPLIGPDGPLALNDRVLLTATPLLAQGIGIPAQIGGTGNPLPDSAVLSAAEVATIRDRTAAFNAIIRDAAAGAGAALVPIDDIFVDIVAEGFPVGGGITYTTDFLTGGIFSYDGVHPTPFGYATVANDFIEAINATYGGSIPEVDLFPFVFGPDGSAGATIPDPTGLGSLAGAVFSDQAGRDLLESLRVFKRPGRRRPGPGPEPDPGGPGAAPEGPIERSPRQEGRSPRGF